MLVKKNTQSQMHRLIRQQNSWELTLTGSSLVYLSDNLTISYVVLSGKTCCSSGRQKMLSVLALWFVKLHISLTIILSDGVMVFSTDSSADTYHVLGITCGGQQGGKLTS